MATLSTQSLQGILLFDQVKDPRWVEIEVAVPQIIQYWKDHDIYQRSPGVASYRHDLPWDVDPARIQSLIDAAKLGTLLPPVELSLSHGKVKGICFPDGRHRLCVASLLGMDTIPAMVKGSEETAIKGHLAVRMRCLQKMKLPRPDRT